ncbi:MAG: glycine cleavage system H protein [Chlamydiota bacterium]
MRFTENHEWIELEGSVGRVGITEAARDEIGDITFIELPKVGQKVKALEEVCVMESSKAAIDIYAPVSGEIISVNHEVVQHPEILQKENGTVKGWLFTIRLSHPKEYDELMDEAAYQAWKYSEK